MFWRKRTKWGLVCVAILLVLTSGVLSGGLAAPREIPKIKIGVIGPMKFCQGENLRDGSMIAAEEINNGKGVMVAGKRYNIELVMADSNEILSVTDAVSAMEEVIAVKKVDFVVGGHKSEAVFAMQDLAVKNKIIFMGCGANHPELCMRVAKEYDKYKYWFRVAPPNAIYSSYAFGFMIEAVAGKIRDQLGIQTPKVAILGEKLVFVDAMIPVFQKLLPQVGTEIVGIWRPATTAADVTAELSATKAAGAQIIMPIMTGPVGIPMVNQWTDLQIPAIIAGLDNQTMAPKYWEITGGKAQYVVCNHFCPRSNITPRTIPFHDKYVKKYKDFPIGWGPGAYNAIYILKEAVEKAGTLDSDAVVVELEKTDFLGAGGRITFMGRDTKTPHDLAFGPKHFWISSTQWIDKNTYSIWPNGRLSKLGEGWEKVNFALRETVLPPWMVEYWKKRS